MRDKILEMIREEIGTFIEEMYEPYDRIKLGDHAIIILSRIDGALSVYDLLKEELAEDENKSCEN